MAVEGRDHIRVSVPAAADAVPGPVTVEAFFWYADSHSFELQPVLDAWRRGNADRVAFRWVPADFDRTAGSRQNFKPQQRLYFALEALGDPDLHERAFTAIHREREYLNTDGAILAWVSGQGVDTAAFAAAFASAEVGSRTRHADAALQAYGIQGVPALVVDGRFRTGPGMLRETSAGFPATLAVLDRLVARAEAGRGGRSAGRTHPVGPRSGP
ncbi:MULTISPECIES: thiol:disulfide interchange protein DsbA/DsbL [unclassified Streptomyces]|uniref:thiol:disulfide interchange protein DsbA/DsbL n=1 Tax=unclassified Streptomyces TaxID=2593676 RepID=UPI0029A7318A|nr:thiol:disulfide interchange protein DsbA/DsbL [Streptomyces sp. DK15]MDX2391289.1 thiol:disulfide interchange protein DsbA/DsbL [Streptomyces sp. DK15]